MASTITLHSLLETHDQPFCIIDASLKVIAVNRAYESLFNMDRTALIGQSCCQVTGDRVTGQPCRHSKLFLDLEPYHTIHSVSDGEGNWRGYQVRGFPLMDSDNLIYLGEAILPVVDSPNSDRTPMAGRSSAFKELLDRLNLAAGSQVPVLLAGETGTGKEIAAKYIHRHSARKNRKLVIVDCRALADDLFESEFFGHEMGAFTGSDGTKIGLFELADQGTLFLDEIGELPLPLQRKLLRTLESGSFRRVGGTQTRHADVRVVCATTGNLLDMVRSGGFREELYNRLAALPVPVPPLRDRREDIGDIALSLLTQIGRCLGKGFHMTPAALHRMQRHGFPGNVRELRNVLQLAAALAPSGHIDAEHLFFGTDWSRLNKTFPSPDDDSSLPRSAPMGPLEDMESSYIAGLLRKHGGNRRLAADEMNVSERTLYRKLKRYHLND